IQILSGQYHSMSRSIDIFSNLGNPAALQRISQAQAAQQSNVGLLLLGYLVLVALVPFTTGAPIRAALDVSLGRPTTIESVVRGTLRRYWALFLVALISVVVAPTICCVVGIWILVSWAVTVPALLEEGAGPFNALSRSWDLVRNNWWRIFGIVI